MKTRLILALFLVMAMTLGSIQVVASYTPPVAPDPLSKDDPLDKIEDLVLEQITINGQTDFFVWLTEKADLSPAYQLETKEEKGRFVYETLRETAERSQKKLCKSLDKQGVDYRAFYIANKILIRGGSQDLVIDLASRADVARITADHQYQLQEPFVEPESPHVLTVEPNIAFVNADDVWALGITGEGTVMAGNDTGLDETHPTIARHYRGCLNPPTCTSWDHNYNWWDATNTYPTNPYDGHGHGTHTTGTMVGDDGGTNQIGMAPGAQTVHCKNMTNSGSGSDATFTECFEWDLAPWDLNGLNPRPDLAPDAVNNSWGYWGGNQNQFRDEIQALHAAGVLVEVSAGNEGPSCATLRSPGDYHEVLTTGSVNHANPYPGTITGFSSRGPSDLDPTPPYYFPDIMAPGQNIRSCLPGNNYGSWNGTSMAGPHATGLVGLIWSAAPSLQGDVETTIQLIRDTAVPLTGQGGSNCGGDYTNGPNNDWGHGTIDALAAVQAAMALEGKAILWDTSHGIYLGYSPSNYYSSLVADLESWGYMVDENSSGVLNLDLTRYAAIVVNLGSNWYSAYSAAEAAAIRDFVEGGGGLIVMGDNSYCPNSNINPVAQLFGTTTGGSSYMYTLSNLAPHYIFNGVSSIYFGAGGALTASSPSYAVAWDSSNRIGVNVARHGRGKVVALGDINLWAQYYTTGDGKDVTRGENAVEGGFITADNRPFAQNVFGWVTSPTVLWDTYHGIYLGYSPSNYFSDLKAILEERGYILHENNSGVLNRDLAAYDAVVVNLGSAWSSAYTTAEADAIQNYVNDGGGLIIMGDNTICPNGNINPVAQRFGTTAGVGSINSTIPNLTPHLIFDNVSMLTFAAGGALSAVAPSRVVGRDSSARAGVNVANSGAGKVVAIGDVNVWDNSRINAGEKDLTREGSEAAAGINTVDNRNFATNTFDWVTSLRGTILWDTSNGIYLGYSPSNYYRNLVTDLGSWGYTVDENSSGVLNVNLFKYVAIVVNLGSSWNSAYSSAEADAIEDFVEDGGGLIVMGDNSICPNGNINPVAQRFGTTTGGSPYIYNITNLTPHHIFNEVTTIYFGTGGVLSASAPSQTIGRDSAGYAAVNVARSGSGRMIGLGDINLWAQYYTYGSEKDVTRDENAAADGFIMANNKPFARHAFDWAAFRSTAP